jgi:GH18 family chitinase
MTALWRRSDVQYLIASIKLAIGNDGWAKARDLMTTVERDTLSDKALLETLATESFQLVDLDCEDPREREKAERIMCGEISEEEQAEYNKKWKAFELLLSEGLCVPSSSLQEAKRRCALHL